MPQLITTKNELEKINKKGKRGLVPTMGALHHGHLSLVEEIQKHCDETWVSIFVNPLQFSAGEDLDQYPRTLESDLAQLEKLNVDYVWAPSTEEMYGDTEVVKIQADPELSNCLCGLSRPGHFDGVCTVVNLLFEQIQADIAIFGEKDYQQVMVIREMVERLKTPVEILNGTIIREDSGLAMSSRNQYLSDDEKKTAANIHQELQTIKNGTGNIEASIRKLTEFGFKVEYLEKRWDRVLFAGKLGQTRLIDNV